MRKLLKCWTCLPFILFIIPTNCGSTQNICKITDKMADCSHLKLYQIPSNLPADITTLDISHNQLKTLLPENLTKYNQLVYLNVGFNSISKLGIHLCLSLPLLEVLRLEHNQLRTLYGEVFTSCTNLRELNVGFNILNTKNDPFKNLKNLAFLDVSHNHLSSTKLGSQQQLGNLQELVMSQNQITKLNKEDLYFLGNSSLKRLDLSSNPIKEFQPGCFQAIENIYGLDLNNVPLGPDGTEKLCLELSGTKIQNLSMSKVQLSRISNVTFSGMSKTNLTILNLSNNYLSVIENASFIYFSNLKELNLMNNNITKLSSHTLYGLQNLNYFNLENSHVRIIDSAFQWLTHLNYLIMDGNKFLEITPHTFKGLENLKNLSLCQCNINSITNMTFASLANSSLQFLNLTKAGIISIKPKAFSWLRQLKMLDLGLNNIKQNLTGQEFQGLSNIETLYLSYNYQLNLTSESFTLIPSLRKLRMRKVRCSNLAITPSPFRKLKNLTILDMGNNNIANIKDDIFDGLHQLEILDLQHNNLARLWKHTNPDGPVLFLKDLHNLRLLDLESNGFDEIPHKAFYGLSLLRSLNLDSNLLNLLPKSVFDDLTSLSFLFLQKNMVTAVDEKVFGAVFKHLKVLNMASNPFDCTCDSIPWFVTWLNSNKTYISNLNNYQCNTPPKYHSNLVAQFDTSICDNAPFKLVFILCTTTILLLIFIAMLVHFQGWRIKFMYTVAVNRVLGIKEIDRQQQQFEYDAYIIHAKKDMNWVSNNFIPLENNQPAIRFCLEERDFEAGISEFEAIVNSIQRSRKIIFIVTKHLLEDPWCKRFKVYHAIQQAIEQSRDSIILIFRHDIPDYKLKNALCLRRAMFKSCCILEWPVQKERLDAFHQQLKSALQSNSRII
ncbi:toll-like receptor 3 [Thamnophis elegans]|uniref:toll-like receptor 3 n=1 Tax=Thamnophis elegans TaxID=35005 RepID=UPI001377EE7C|nr:toll-like receptor 3 [Thamnophis elegans]XP_032079734.1 toll-like receptor 3 [Thamnophis elegans]XP_032079735.1 toll-like receptor 3 [Thamnophis elegans]